MLFLASRLVHLEAVDYFLLPEFVLVVIEFTMSTAPFAAHVPIAQS